MPAKLVTYNSQNYASKLGSGLSLDLLIILVIQDLNCTTFCDILSEMCMALM